MLLLGGVLLIAGAATGLQILRQCLWMVWGAPFSWLFPIGLAGSALICFGGCRAISNGVGLRAAVLGLLLAWAFYGPALSETVSVIHEAGVADSEDRRELLRALVPPALLVAASVAVLVTCMVVACRSEWSRHG
jgi:hypothetical protein